MPCRRGRQNCVSEKNKIIYKDTMQHHIHDYLTSIQLLKRTYIGGVSEYTNIYLNVYLKIWLNIVDIFINVFDARCIIWFSSVNMHEHTSSTNIRYPDELDENFRMHVHTTWESLHKLYKHVIRLYGLQYLHKSIYNDIR